MQKFHLTEGSVADINAQFPLETNDVKQGILESISYDSDEIIFNDFTIPLNPSVGDRFFVSFFVLHRRDDNASEYVADFVKLADEFLLVEIVTRDPNYEAIILEGEEVYGLSKLKRS